MTTAGSADEVQPAQRQWRAGLAGTGILAIVFVAGVAWAKWLPYAAKASRLSSGHTWAGGSLLTVPGAPGAAPTLTGAWHFSSTYFSEVWKGFLVALVIAAALDALVPQAWLLTIMNRRTRLGQAVTGGAAALPSLMCTCCSSPLAVGLRKRGVSTTASLAYWLGNPVLNPAVLVFLFLVAPWQFGVVRLGIGVLVVAGGAALVTRLFAAPGADPVLPPELRAPPAADPAGFRQFPVRFARALALLAVILVPAYIVMVALLGYVSGWLSGFVGLDARLGIMAVLACAVIGTLLVVPTGGEIPVVLALAAAGTGAGTVGALLITLPALSIPSMVMVGRALSWRVTLAAAGMVAAAGLAAGALLWLLT